MENENDDAKRSARNRPSMNNPWLEAIERRTEELRRERFRRNVLILLASLSTAGVVLAALLWMRDVGGI